jgi:RNA 2',3'-cyclic 3'-phosphodiesterase
VTGPAPPEASLRTFVALPFAEADLARLAALVESLRAEVPGLRWTRPDGLHLTLRFLGASPPAALERLAPLLRGSVAETRPCAIRVAGLGLFPERGKARVLWLGVDLPRALLDLQAGCEAAAQAVGFPADARAFIPHVTLGRWRDPARRPELRPVDLGEMRVDRLVLFRSDQRRGGAVYTPLQVHPLGGA